MPAPAGLACVRCGTVYPADAYASDCPACKETAPANLAVAYEPGYLDGVTQDRLGGGPDSLWRYDHSLPVAASDAVSLGEGRTPLVALPAMAEALGVAEIHGKAEYANPTGSFKDRLASVAVSAARTLFGAKVIATSSSGNAGAAAAAYAARAGLPCVVFTMTSSAGPMVAQMRSYGAALVAVEDYSHRWLLLEEGVRKFGWFPTSPFFGPVVGSNPFGVEGYKSFAYELFEQLGGKVPDWVVLPICYGDALAGMWRGFDELRRLGWSDRMPKLAAAEIYGSLSAALRDEVDAPPAMPHTHDTVAISIGAVQGTHQALAAIRASGGAAAWVPDQDLLRWHDRLATEEGLFVEPTSAAALAAIEILKRDGSMGSDDAVVAILTAGGLKDPQRGARSAGPVPVVPPDLDAAVTALRDTYGLDATR